MNSNNSVVATFQDKYGDERKIHNTRHGLTLRRRTDTTNILLGRSIAKYVGERVRILRQAREMSMEELGLRAGLMSSGSTMKQRIYEIEKGPRGTGLRLGTLYQLAIALGVEVTEILPTAETVKSMTGINIMQAEMLSKS